MEGINELQYFIMALVKKSDMLHTYAALLHNLSLLKGSDRDQYVLGENGENLENVLEGVNALSHQCIGGENLYIT